MSLNALSPDHMTPAERLREIGEIIAAGLIRLRARQEKVAERGSGDSSVDFPGDQSVHGRNNHERRNGRE